MKRQTAMKEWRDVTRGAPEGVPTGRTVHAFAQRVEERTIAHLRELLRDADEALRDLGACNDSDCEEPNCLHVRQRIAALVGHNAGLGPS